VYKFVITTSKGLDELLKQEVEGLAQSNQIELENVKLTPGQVSFEADLSIGYQLCLHSRLANRVLLVLAEGKVNEAQDLYDIAYSVDWTMHFASHVPFVIHFNGVNKVINNSQFGALKTKDAIVDRFTDDASDRPSVDKQNPGIIFQGRLKRDHFQLCLDMSGGSLHRRGYREDAGEAPLKEHVSAALLIRSGWASDNKALLDPMCGSGTIAIEAALMATNTPPNLDRADWGFDHWLQHNNSVWQNVIEQGKSNITDAKCPIFASDLSTKVLDIAKANARMAGMEQYIEFKQCDALTLGSAPAEQGYLISNPPYGERLNEYTSLIPFFDELGQSLKSLFASWTIGLLSSNQDLLKALKLRYNKRYKLMNGKLDCVFCLYDMSGDNLDSFESKLDENHEFANRLRKNLKKLQPFIKKNTTNAYRVYDADLPHYNLAIDRYDNWVVVQEYAAPKNVPEEKAKQRLQEALLYIPKVLDIDPSQMSVKVRRQNKGKQQYEKVDKKGLRLTVFENQAQFYVNPTDYLDVGLFLDHRDTRQLFKQHCKDKNVLNLFAYTGSVSVHAAMGTAKSVTTVDMSNTYLEWAKDNFKLNNLSGNFEFIQADCLTWLSRCHNKYDLMFIDPPSFSNSKRMNDTWDVQRDHLKLLSDAKACLSENGKIFFSNNLRQFKLDEAALIELGFKVKDISNQTIPIDFARNQKIHKCWILSL
jgi:23S rRNA (guanine2445-N2)-methyltransferase / 23S rRNA (guanine2069-N7)-methyltransferase